ncbi:MAG TPA: hypothetical protein VNR86_10365 [Sphingomicrobium sp.]|nr:hypothetical protein [Sphingomicrobium sp.]
MSPGAPSIAGHGSGRGCIPFPGARRPSGLRVDLRPFPPPPLNSRLKGAAIEAALFLTLGACATAQMHSEEQLNEVALSCGLSQGDVVQETEEKRLLFLYRIAPKPQQRHCVYEWARRNHLTLVTINAVNEAPGPQS